MTRMNDPVRLALRVEFSATAEPVEGVVRFGGGPAQPFSGWSELFAVLMTLTSEAGEHAVAPDRGAWPAQQPDATAQSEERRNHPCQPS
jgi:hypothetical protein